MNQGAKQRIVGTVVLLALALIFLPIIFDGQGSYQTDLTSRIPAQPIISILPQPLQTRPVIIADTDAIELADELLAESSSSDAAVANTETSPEENTVEVTTSEAVFSREVPQLASNGLPEAWSVRLGSFSDSSNADKLMQDLQDSGYKAYTRILQREQGALTAVFVGPWLDRLSAGEYKQKLEEQFPLAALVVPYEIEKL